MKRLFTERHGAIKPRTAEALDDTARSALLNLVRARMDEEWFGLAFPEKCPDGYAHAGTDFAKMQATMDGYGLHWPRQAVDPESPLSDGAVFDLVEFSYEHVAEARNPEFHRYWGHSHYTYDLETGRGKFAHDVNRIFERNGMAFELVDGEVIRRAPAGIDDALAQTLFQSGDAQLDKLLEAARQKFLHRNLDIRREALEKLWDAWERLKTLEPGKDKKASTTALLDKVTSEPTLRGCLELEARELTDIGNTFMIRHTETNKVPVTESAQVDYLFHRLFAVIRLILRATGRGG
jgi:AbiJ-like protein